MTLHRIRRQRWQVAVPDATTAFAMRLLLRRTQDSTLLPALAEAFDAVDVGEREVHIPRLHVRLDFASADGLASARPDRLRVAVGQALREALQGGAAGPGAEAPRDIAPAERLVAYLASGRLAWFDAGREPPAARALLAEEAARWTQSPETNWPRLLAVPAAEGHGLAEVFFRFLQLLDDAQRARWMQFARQPAAGPAARVAEALAELLGLYASRPADHRLRLQALALLWLAVGASVPAAAAQWPGALAAVRALPAPGGELAAAAWARIESAGRSATQRAEAVADLADAPANATVGGKKGPNLKFDDQPAPGLPVAACGLVLLHPYLPRLFAGLGWIADDHPVGQPLPPAVLPPAAALLHWLATGRDEPYEFELPLIKILLGLAPDDPLPVAAGLLDAALCEEGEALLSAAIAHWPALGQTSIAGLRVSFLQRAGLLYPAPDGWLLRPQSETYDLLLDRLPWGISLIRLGWMRGCLHTEWTTA
jgi:hypothetical protein